MLCKQFHPRPRFTFTRVSPSLFGNAERELGWSWVVENLPRMHKIFSVPSTAEKVWGVGWGELYLLVLY